MSVRTAAAVFQRDRSGDPRRPQNRRRDAEAWADLYGIEFIEPTSHVIDSQLLGRGAVAAGHMNRVRPRQNWRHLPHTGLSEELRPPSDTQYRCVRAFGIDGFKGLPLHL